MNIRGLQKLTLLDFPDRLACTVFTNGCNFRCPFCHNASLVLYHAPAVISVNELIDFLKSRVGRLDGVCFTGGEPLLQSDLADVMRRIKELGFEIKLDTNGSSPARMIPLVEEGLVDYIAMDIKNCPARYAETAGLPMIDLSPILESVQYLLSDQVAYEFRTTLVQQFHTKEDMQAIGEWLKGAKQYYLQTFKDSGDLIRQDLGLCACSPEQQEEFLAIVRQTIPAAQIRGE